MHHYIQTLDYRIKAEQHANSNDAMSEQNQQGGEMLPETIITNPKENKTMKTTTQKLNPFDIIVPEGRRVIAPEKVQEFVESIKINNGLINPITVRKVGKKYVLVAGGHRLAAIKQLGYTEIDCLIVECDDLQAELLEIDENLIRNDITDPITIGELANRRDEILEKKGLRAKVGDNRHTKARGAGAAPLKTTADFAKDIGISVRTLQENKQLARNLVQEAKDTIRKEELTKDTALALSRLTPEEQREIVSCGDKNVIIATLQNEQTQPK